MSNPKYRPVNDAELIESIRLECIDEIERIENYEDDCRLFNMKMDLEVLSNKSVYSKILNKIEQREYLRTEIKE